MEKMLEKLNTMEEKIIRTLDLMEIAKSYCEHNFDKGEEIVALSSLITVLIERQKELVDYIDDMV